MTYRDELSRELAAVGISGRLRARIVAEFDDHIACDPDSQLGEPVAIARQFADELGTSRARRAAFASFVALAVAGIVFAVAFVAAPAPVFGAAASRSTWLVRLATWCGALAPQVAFAAGTLAVLRAFRRRHESVMAGAESRMILRRAAVGLIFGIASLASLIVIAAQLRHMPGWWRTLAEVDGAVGATALLAGVPALVTAWRLPSLAPGPAGDLSDDIGSWLPASLRTRPWRVAWALALGLFILLAATGFMADDGPDGVVRGILDGGLCLLVFGTAGRYLGLWSSSGDRGSAPGAR